jgi:hypothetical protein
MIDNINEDYKTHTQQLHPGERVLKNEILIDVIFNAKLYQVDVASVVVGPTQCAKVPLLLQLISENIFSTCNIFFKTCTKACYLMYATHIYTNNEIVNFSEPDFKNSIFNFKLRVMGLYGGADRPSSTHSMGLRSRTNRGRGSEPARSRRTSIRYWQPPASAASTPARPRRPENREIEIDPEKKEAKRDEVAESEAEDQTKPTPEEPKEPESSSWSSTGHISDEYLAQWYHLNEKMITRLREVEEEIPDEFEYDPQYDDADRIADRTEQLELEDNPRRTTQTSRRGPIIPFGVPAQGALVVDEATRRLNMNHLGEVKITIDGVDEDKNLTEILRFNSMASSLKLYEEDIIMCFARRVMGRALTPWYLGASYFASIGVVPTWSERIRDFVSRLLPDSKAVEVYLMSNISNEKITDINEYGSRVGNWLAILTILGKVRPTDESLLLQLTMKLPVKLGIDFQAHKRTNPRELNTFDKAIEWLRVRQSEIRQAQAVAAMNNKETPIHTGQNFRKPRPCNICGSNKHDSWQCFEEQRNERSQERPGLPRGCRICGADGHFARECPQKSFQNRNPRGGPGFKSTPHFARENRFKPTAVDQESTQSTVSLTREITCWKCQAKGHYANRCPKKAIPSSIDRKGSSTATIVCCICDEINPRHSPQDCPELGSLKSMKTNISSNRGRGGRSGNALCHWVWRKRKNQKKESLISIPRYSVKSQMENTYQNSWHTSTVAPMSLR